MTSALPEVLEKLERATPGKWRAGFMHDGEFVESTTDGGALQKGDGSFLAVSKTANGYNYQDAKAIAAAVNFLREHGPALLASQQYAEANPLGGPASMLEAAARRIRAGEDFHEVLADYDLHSRPALLRDAGDGWLPIETLVRDGRRVLTWHDAGMVVANPQHFAFGQRGWVSTQAAVKGLLATEYCDTGTVTHWRPLPQPPAMHAPGGG